MSFIRNNIKPIITFILGVVLASGIAVYASINANTVDYTNNKKVSDALNELYGNMSNETKSITTNGQQTLDKYYKNLNVNVNATITKTLLWTNESPTTGMDNGTIELSAPLTNFSHILMQWYVSTTNTTMIEDIFKVDYRDVLSTNDNAYFAIAHRVADGPSGGCNYNRLFWKASNNELGYSYGGFGSSNGDFNTCIPYKIYGLNFTY